MRIAWMSTGALVVARDLGEERAFLPVALDEMHAEIRPPGFEDGEDQPGKTCPRAEIQPESRVRRKGA